ncbi:MAG: HAD family hydrolase [Lachnospiraceae bacterium]
MYQCCIFDLDGTLLDTIHALTFTTNRVLERFGLGPVDEAHMMQFVGNGYEKQLERSLRHCGDQDLKYLEEAKPVYLEEFAKHCMHQVAPYEGIPELLAYLKEQGIRIAVLSNKPHARTLENIHTVFGADYFDLVAGERRDVPRKPDPTGALLMAEELEVKPEHCLYLGDTNTDMETGIGAGMDTVGVTWGFRSREELESFHPKYVVDHPSQVIEIVKKANET